MTSSASMMCAKWCATATPKRVLDKRAPIDDYYSQERCEGYFPHRSARSPHVVSPVGDGGIGVFPGGSHAKSPAPLRHPRMPGPGAHRHHPLPAVRDSQAGRLPQPTRPDHQRPLQEPRPRPLPQAGPGTRPGLRAVPRRHRHRCRPLATQPARTPGGRREPQRPRPRPRAVPSMPRQGDRPPAARRLEQAPITKRPPAVAPAEGLSAPDITRRRHD